MSKMSICSSSLSSKCLLLTTSAIFFHSWKAYQTKCAVQTWHSMQYLSWPCKIIDILWIQLHGCDCLIDHIHSGSSITLMYITVLSLISTFHYIQSLKQLLIVFNIIASHNVQYLLVTDMFVLCHAVPVENKKSEARLQALPFQNFPPCFDQLSDLLFSSWSFLVEEQKAIAVLFH